MRTKSDSPLVAEVPERLGRYRPCFVLASGGMATVYLAFSEGAAGFEKVVAIKRVHPHLARERDFVEMFLDEARIASRITHPNVCHVFDFGQAGGTYYIAMEYILGETVGRVMKRARKHAFDEKSFAYAARIVADAAEGLHAAHELRGDDGEPLHVVHRDVSPQNLFVGYDGTIRVVDFGIARAAGRVHVTRTGIVKGKLSYMAPEQTRKKPLDRRADVWALGVILWELVTGKRLFDGETDADVVLALVTETINPPSAVRPEVPAELDRIVMRALEREPEKRYATARELGRDLNRFIMAWGEPASSADVAEWMGELFPSEEKKRRQVIDSARQKLTSAARAMRESIEELDLPASGQFPVEPDLPPLPQTPSLPPSMPPPEAAAETAGDTLVSAEIFAPDTQRKRVVAIAAAAVLSLGALVATVIALSGGDEAPATPATPPPAAARAVNDTQPTAPPERGAAAPATPPSAGAPEPPAAPAEEPPPDPAVIPRARTTRREQHAQPARPREPGRVNVATPGGWADIYVGTRHVGRAPGSIELPAGRQFVRIHPFGREEGQRVAVDVPAGGQTRVVVPVSP